MLLDVVDVLSLRGIRNERPVAEGEQDPISLLLEIDSAYSCML